MQYKKLDSKNIKGKKHSMLSTRAQMSVVWALSHNRSLPSVVKIVAAR